MGHTMAGNSLGIYKGGAFVVGGRDYASWHHQMPYCKMPYTEILNFVNGELKWKSYQDYPFHSRSADIR